MFYYVFNKLTGYETFEKRRGQPCSFIMYSAADYVEMLIIYGECGNEVNPHALFSRAFQQRFYINLWVGLLGNRVVCLQ
jgi:hypothetical protein